MSDSRTVRDVGEKRIIEEIIRPICGAVNVELGIGDDAAMVRVPPGCDLLVSTDKIPEDLLSIQIGLMDAFNHGRYLAMVNISDIAAMGGTPSGLLVTLALPEDFAIAYLTDFYKGLAEGCREYGCGVIGGDLGWGSVACMSATAIGFVEPALALTRKTARPGDALFVTGLVGGFNTALLYFIVARPRGLDLPAADEEFLRKKLIRPLAQVKAGRALAYSRACSSCMDITDGVGRSIQELTTASDVGFEVTESHLPIHPSTRTVASFLDMDLADIVFGIGLDLELIGTISKDALLPETLSNQLVLIGSATSQKRNVLNRHDGRVIEIPQRGWQHFTGKAMDIVKASAHS